MEFSEIGIDSSLIKSLETEGIRNPFPVQEKVIPEIFKGLNMAVRSETGSGKTLAFLLPLLQMTDFSVENCQIIIIAPSHELASQINDQAGRLIQYSALPVRSQLIIGNVNIKRQIENLRKKPHIIVGTHGRISDLVRQKKIKPHKVKAIVIDEADIMMSGEGFDSVKYIAGASPGRRQLLFFSATISEAAMARIRNIWPEASLTGIETVSKKQGDVEHLCFSVSGKREKFRLLRKLLSALNPERAVIFVRTNTDAADLLERLKHHNISAEGLHGLNEKLQRRRSLDAFRKGKTALLVASDLAARGLDIDNITHVINFSIPGTAEEYLHRAGRTGRAGMPGMVLSIAASGEIETIRSFKEKLGLYISEKKLADGMISDI